MCRCLQEDAVWKRKQNEVEAVLMGAFGESKGRNLVSGDERETFRCHNWMVGLGEVKR